jgi:hypothetical protein
VRGARRVLAKVRGLSSRRPSYHPVFRKRYHKRGDLDPFLYAAEDEADYRDELEEYELEEDGRSVNSFRGE